MADHSVHAITDLFDAPEHIPVVAQWIYDEFWSDKDELTAAELARLLGTATHPDAIPLSLLAWMDGRPVGTVNLIENDDSQRTHLRPWLAALFVCEGQRGRGIGSALVRAVLQRADELSIPRVYLGTDNPGFYRRLGATVHEALDESFCVMQMATR